MLEASVRDMLTLACPGCRELMFGHPPLCARSDMQAGRNDHGVFTPRKSENTVYWSFSFPRELKHATLLTGDYQFASKHINICKILIKKALIIRLRSRTKHAR